MRQNGSQVSSTESCQTCGDAFGDEYYDARTAMGPWACMCRRCFTRGPGLNRLGTGLGQRFTRQGGAWVKAEG